MSSGNKPNAVVDFLIALLFGCGFAAGAFYAIHRATKIHWALGICATIFVALGALFGLVMLRMREKKREEKYPIYLGVIVALVTACCAISVAASVSTQLVYARRGNYEPPLPRKYSETTDDFQKAAKYDKEAYDKFVRYYVWVFLDMLPGLHADRLLTFDPDLKPQRGVAQIPVVVFRGFVIFGLLASLRVWWKGRIQGDGRIESGDDAAKVAQPEAKVLPKVDESRLIIPGR